jgi:3-hydroxybutyryl-CoA dehydrogenase
MEIERIGVVGAGTMGAGIAQIACLGGFQTHLHDAVPDALQRGAQSLRQGLSKGAERERWSAEEAEAAEGRLRLAVQLSDLAPCQLVIEAVPEDLELKRRLFGEIAEVCSPDAVLATNTSSLPVTAIAAAVPGPERVVGMHFFNPPALMELVEIVAGEESAEAALATATDVARRMGRRAIRASDRPGFLANRLARPYTLEALRILAEGEVDHELIDRACRVGGGFRMGPFELMDLVGIDVNFGVARSFFEQSFGEPRWRPSPIQQRLVHAGRVGRKSGRGFYDYSGESHRPPDPDPPAERPILDPAELDPVAGDGAAAALERIAAQIVNEAAFALQEGVGSPGDMDEAMRLGFNWPVGPLEWGELIGWSRALGILEDLRELHGEAYRPAPKLRDLAAGGVAPTREP